MKGTPYYDMAIDAGCVTEEERIQMAQMIMEEEQRAFDEEAMELEQEQLRQEQDILHQQEGLSRGDG